MLQKYFRILELIGNLIANDFDKTYITIVFAPSSSGSFLGSVFVILILFFVLAWCIHSFSLDIL